MCRNLRDGGQRCATHTRPGYQTVMGSVDPTEVPVGDLANRVDDGFDAIVDYAATRSGARKVRDDREALAAHFATLDGAPARRVADQARVLAALDYALRKAEARTAANAATRRAARATTPATLPPPAAPPAAAAPLRQTMPFATRQGYRMENIVEVDGHQVRVTIQRDFYDAQSRFTAEVWTGAGWRPVTGVSGNDPQGKAMPSSSLAKHTNAAATVQQAALAMHERLVSETRAVLGDTTAPARPPVTRSEPVVVGSPSLTGGRQGYDSTRIVEVDGHKVRTIVHADTFYQFQSSLTAQVWTDDGWKGAAYIHPLDPKAPDLPHAGALSYPNSPDYTEHATRASEACEIAHDQLLAQVRDLL